MISTKLPTERRGKDENHCCAASNNMDGKALQCMASKSPKISIAFLER